MPHKKNICRFAALLLFASVPAHAQEKCKDCDPVTGLTVRETIQAARARDAKRVTDEPTARPWDGLDLGGSKNAPKRPGLTE